MEDGIAALVRLGFTDLEARIYAFLVANSPSTGYRISQGIGKPVANTYKALQTLERKGAILIDPSGKRQCSAIPPTDLLDQLGRNYESQRSQAELALKDLGQPAQSNAVFTLSTLGATFARAQQLIATAQQVILISCPTSLTSEFQTELLAAHLREVLVCAFANIETLEYDVTIPSEEPDTLLIVVDQKSFVSASFTSGDFADGFAGTDSSLAKALHDGLAAEITLSNLRRRIEDGAGQKRLTRALEAHKGRTI